MYITEDFLCKKSHRCIPQSWVCNGEDDCGTGEDEHEGCGRNICLLHDKHLPKVPKMKIIEFAINIGQNIILND